MNNGLNKYEKRHEVDSGALAHMIEEEGMQQVSKDVNLAYALIWYDKRDHTLHFCRNTERPLYMLETTSNYFFVSELDMMIWILNRHGEKILNQMEVPPHIEFIINVANLDIDQKELSQNKVYSYATSYNDRTYYGAGYDTKKEGPKDSKILYDLIGKNITFKIKHYVKTIDKKQAPELTYIGNYTKDIEVKFITRKELPANFRDLEWTAQVNSVEKVGNSHKLLLKTKTVKEKQEEVDDQLDQFDKTILDLGDGNNLLGIDFKEMMKFGCGNCGAALRKEDHPFYALTPDDERLLCTNCTSEFLTDTERFKEKLLKKKHVH